MKNLGLLVLLLSPSGCGLLKSEPLNDPATHQYLDQVAQAAAKKAALDLAAQFQVTDQSAVQRMVDEAKTAATAATNAAVARFESQDRVSRAKWREDTKAQIAASLQGVGGATQSAGVISRNPLLVGLGAVVAAAGGLFLNKKRKERKEALSGNAARV
jgi:hypothetical protein